MRATRFLTIVLSLSVGAFSYAASDDDKCITALSPTENQSEQLDLDKHFHDLAQLWKTGWTDRGFLGLANNSPELNAETYMAALKNGVIWWNIRMYFVRDIDEAKAHDALIDDPMMKGVYIIDADEAEVEFKSKDDAAEPRREMKGETLRQVLQRTNGFIEILADGGIRNIPMSEVSSRLFLTNLTKHDPDKYSHGKNFFGHPGWAATKQRGLVYYDNFSKGSAAQRGRKLARKLIGLGYEIKVNGDYQKALEMAKDQLRVVEIDGVKTYKATSRYKLKTLFDAISAMYQKDLAFSVELYRPDGKMVGGSINFVVGNLITGDTIFYDIKETSYVDELGRTVHIDPIEFARLVDVVTFEYMVALGIPFLDVGMVTYYSESLKADLLSREEYLKEINTLPKEPIRLPSILDPYQYPESGFAELAKGAKVKTFTKSRFLGGLAHVTDHSVARAGEHGLVPAELLIFVVKDSKEAEMHAKSAGYKDNAIYFMSGQNPVNIPGEEGAAANELIDLVLKNGAVVVDSATGKAKMIQAQRFKGILNSKLSTQYMRWNNRHVIVKGWRLGP